MIVIQYISIYQQTVILRRFLVRMLCHASQQYVSILY